jgi:Ca2+-binding RTX toxin-like protein
MTGIRLIVRQRRPVLLGVASLCLLALGLAPQASAAGSGFFFTPTGSMSVPRTAAAAAPLPDGRVLVAGGEPNLFNDIHSSAELFNPATNTFSSAGIGSMSVPRGNPAAAPLPDGRVLVAGGRAYNVGELSSAEVFDPATNSFSSAGIGSMSVPRSGAVAAPLPDGRVLVAGGGQGVGTGGSAEVFNPATNSFSSAGIGSMSVPLISPAAAPLPDGRVLVAGGSTGGRGPIHLSSAQVFNPATNSFSSAGIGSMTVPRSGAGAAPLPDGRVLVAGGYDGSNLLSSAEVFDPATNTFSSAGIGSMSVPRTAAAAAPLPDGRVLVAGGLYYDGTSQILSSAEIFAPAICGDKQATIVGTEGIDYTTGRADDITGTRGSDVIVGLSGNDKLNGLAGNDLICGGAGKDTLNGGKGNDRLYGEAGNDTLKGGPGKDKLKGGPGKDELKGGPGKDKLKGGPGKDKQVQ